MKSKPISAQEDKVWRLKPGRTTEAFPLWITDALHSLAGRRAKKLVIDLADAGHIDTRGLRHLLSLNELLKGESVQLVLLNPCPQFHRILQIMQLHRVFTIEFDTEAIWPGPAYQEKARRQPNSRR